MNADLCRKCVGRVSQTSVTVAAPRTVPRARLAPAQDDISPTKSSAHRVLFDFDCDFRRMEERVVDEAVVDGAFDAGAVLVG